MISAISCYPARRSRADPDVILPAATTVSAATPARLIGSFNRFRPESPVLTPAIKQGHLFRRPPEPAPRAYPLPSPVKTTHQVTGHTPVTSPAGVISPCFSYERLGFLRAQRSSLEIIDALAIARYVALPVKVLIPG